MALGSRSKASGYLEGRRRANREVQRANSGWVEGNEPQKKTGIRFDFIDRVERFVWAAAGSNSAGTKGSTQLLPDSRGEAGGSERKNKTGVRVDFL